MSVEVTSLRERLQERETTIETLHREAAIANQVCSKATENDFLCLGSSVPHRYSAFGSFVLPRSVVVGNRAANSILNPPH